MKSSNSSATFGDVLKNRRFLALWLAQFVSSFGDWLALLALFSLVAFRLRGTAYEVSGVFIAFVIPVAFLGPIAGVFVDRWNLKRTMIASDLVRAVLAALLAFATDLYQVYCLVFALSAVSCFFMPAQAVALPLVVSKEELLVANALNAQTVQFNKIISPAIAGVVVASFGEKACFYIDSLTFVFSAALLSTIALGRELTTIKGIGPILQELREGLQFVLRHRAVRFVVLSMVAAVFAAGAFDALIAVYVRDVLRSDSPIFGALVSLVGVGTIIGALLLSRFGQRQPKIYLVVSGILGVGVGILIIAASSSAAVALLCSGWLGVAVSAVLVPSQTLIQEETPAGILGRVSSTSIALITSAQLVAISIAGKVADWVGIRNLYFFVSFILIFTGLFGYAYARVNRVAEAKAPSASS